MLSEIGEGQRLLMLWSVKMETRGQADIVVDAIIVSYNTRELTLACIRTLLASEGVQTAITVVDNNSSDATPEAVEGAYPEATVVRSAVNLGYGGGINRGAREGDAPYLLISNTDVEYEPDALRLLVGYMEAHPEVGAVGPQQVFPDGSWQRSFGAQPGLLESLEGLTGLGAAGRLLRRALWPRVRIDRRPRPVPYIDGAIMLVRRTAFAEVGGFDESFTHYAEEVDLCRRLQQAGWETVFVPDARVMHIRGASSRTTPERRRAYGERLVKSKLQFMEKHASAREKALYTRSQALYAAEMYALNRVGSMLAPRAAWRARAAERASTFRHNLRLWYAAA